MSLCFDFFGIKVKKLKVLFHYIISQRQLSLRSLGRSALEFLEQCFPISVPLSAMPTRIASNLFMPSKPSSFTYVTGRNNAGKKNKKQKSFLLKSNEHRNYSISEEIIDLLSK